MVNLDRQQTQPVVNRLKRAEGQLRGVLAMLDEGRACEDVVTQLAAVSKAIDRAAFTLVAEGIRECVSQAEAGEEIDMAKLQKVFLALA